jgi:DNA-binding transcriptional MerR regulator
MKTQNPDDEGMLIGELARKANVSVRTIRFYISEGLLPAPQVRGRFASYGEDALVRLQVIRLLKEVFLPLREIRERLAGLSTADVNKLLVDLEQMPAKPQASISPAVEYIDRLAARKDVYRSPAVKQDVPITPAPSRRPPESRPPSQCQPERWRHFTLAPGVILQASEGLDSASEKKLEEVIRIASRLFSSQGVKDV